MRHKQANPVYGFQMLCTYKRSPSVVKTIGRRLRFTSFVRGVGANASIANNLRANETR